VRASSKAFSLSSLTLAIIAANAAAETQLQTVTVRGLRELGVAATTGDAVKLLENQAGVSFYTAGGASRLPVLHGLNDDRVKLLIDGAPSTSACANHMNPALSYVDASQVRSIEVMAGITPVSLGGDSIAGTIAVQSALPEYAKGADLYSAGSLSAYFKSVNSTTGFAASAAIADTHFSLGYDGAIEKAKSYDDGNGDKVLDTLYKTENHAITFGARDDVQQFVARFGHQEIPYQGYVNQFMDMVDNSSDSIKLQYTRDMRWGELEARAFWQDVSHEMGFFTREKTGVMPMNTEGKDVGYVVQANVELGRDHTLRIGHDFHRFTLDDWWPAVPGSMMMGPLDYVNINDGERDRLGLFVESDYRWNTQWSTLLGLRGDRVKMDTGNVQPYSWMAGMMNVDRAAALAFNARDHQRDDDHIDLTALARYEPAKTATYEFGYARKTRSPNLYERYSWGVGTMATRMIGWFGDANGYVGNMDLEPEIAHTVSATADWHDAQRALWEIKVTPYYTKVDDYIDADVIGTTTLTGGITRNTLRFANHDATLYGVDLSGQVRVWENAAFGAGVLRGVLGYVRGERDDIDDNLYHQMPLNAKLTLEQNIRAWTNTIELQTVARKSRVQDLRLEEESAGYALVNLRTAYDMKPVRIEAGISNLFDRYYDLPLGGANIAEWKHSGTLGAVPGPGRSLDVGVTLRF
jgi:iron complex outermembrane receptor protein